MRVLLISANTEQINMPVMPFGLACVKQAVEAAGHEAQALNLMTAADIDARVAGTLTDFAPDVIGISVRNIDDQSMQRKKFLLPPARDVVDLCRRVSRGKIVLGGAGYSIFPESALAYLGADMGIQGEGEGAFVTLLECLAKNSALDRVPGLHRSHGRQAEKTLRQPVLDRFELPRPDSGLTSHPEMEANDIWMPFQTRRGCPMDCIYCSTAAIEGRRLRKRTISEVVQGLKRYVGAGIRKFFMADNTFNLPLSYAKDLCDAIVSSRLNIRWQAILYPHQVDEALIVKMARAGCVGVSLGYESAHPGMLRTLNKPFSPGSVAAISERLKVHGIRRMGFLLLGGPGETFESVKTSVGFAERVDMEMVRLTVGIRIYPHTKLEKIARSERVVDTTNNLLFPTFYLQEELKDWLPEKAKEWTDSHPNWIM